MIQVPKASQRGEVKNMKRKLIFATAAILLSVLMFPQIAVAPPSANSLNTKFIKWQERENVIHILVFDDAGRPGQPPAHVLIGQSIIFGFEWAVGTVEELQAYVDNPDHLFELSVDGGAFVSVKGGYQDAFTAATGSGPRWSWDHDGDGPGDGDGDGIGDWNGPVLFWRYYWPGLPAGIHTFEFRYSDDGGPWYGEIITVVAGPSARSLNKWFIEWQERENVIHILVFDDAGRPGQPPAEVAVDQPIIFGFEWADGSVEDLQASVDDPDHLFELSVDGGAFVSVKGGYQDAFTAATGSGPRWSWDHDGDGPGDGDGDGIGDWNGPVLFWRYYWPGLPAGIHTFEFGFSYDGGIDWFYELITVQVS
ncbi:MAG: hypothetical protein ACFE7E_08600 [Candidatus Hodarchaeota archaeon]